MSVAARSGAAGGLANSWTEAVMGPTLASVLHCRKAGFSLIGRKRAAPRVCYKFSSLGGEAMSTIESVLQETRVFQPPAELVKHANVSGMEAYPALRAE